MHAALHEWRYPLTRTEILLLDLIDITGAAASKKGAWKPLKRPWKSSGQRFGRTELPREEAIDLLRRNAGR